jgi:hypothetical protein
MRNFVGGAVVAVFGFLLVFGNVVHEPVFWQLMGAIVGAVALYELYAATFGRIKRLEQRVSHLESLVRPKG